MERSTSNSVRGFLAAALLVVAAVAAACGGGGGGGSTTTTVTSLSEAQGVYSLSTIEADARTAGLDASGSEIYLVVDSPFVAFYGKDGSCFDLGTVSGETAADGSVSATVSFESDTSARPSCLTTLQSTYGLRGGDDGKSLSTLEILLIFSFLNGRIDRVRLVNLFILQWTVLKLHQAVLSGNAATMTYQTAFTLIAALIASIINNSPSTTAPTDTPSDTPTASNSPSIAQSCTGVKHGSGRSWVRACIQALSVLAGGKVDWQFGSGFPVWSLLNASLIACYDFQINHYATYGWTASLADHSDVTASGSLKVTSSEQDCSPAPFDTSPVGTFN